MTWLFWPFRKPRVDVNGTGSGARSAANDSEHCNAGKTQDSD
jgi:hypothetical protein